MTASDDRWARVSRLFDAARACPALERAAFLAEACEGDAALQQEVLSLLEQPTSPGALEQLTPSAVARALAPRSAHSPTGRRFGSYVLGEKIGAGGMGEVYHARDTRLGRAVAVKVLPDAFAGDADRLARFEREAMVLASLNHPNIATIHGIEDVDGVKALILELIEGETLAHRLMSGPLAIRDALQYARQIAEALEAAHDRGVIHRDLKPANIKITPGGVVKVLDFGLAKAVSATDLSPTVTIGATAEGAILGTPGYMSPEQAKGQTVDKRADIWAFGCVLYEMLTGRAVFAKATWPETLAGILEREPDLAALPETPSDVVRLLTRCLEKDPRRRLRDIGEARIEVENALQDRGDPGERGTSGLRPPQARRPRWVPVAAVMSLVAVAVVAFLVWRPDRAPASNASTTRAILTLAPAEAFGPGPAQISPGFPYPTRTDVALSPNGAVLVFSGREAGRQQLYQRPLDRLIATPIPGTESSNNPFFSPDGQWLGFWVGVDETGAIGELKKVRLDGGPAITLARVAPLRGATWGPADIVFATVEGAGRLWKVPADGGRPVSLIPDEAAADPNNLYRLPHLLPDGQHVLFTMGDAPSASEDGRTGVLSLETGESHVVLEKGIDARYAQSGHLVYMRGGALMAAPFDLETLRVSGTATAIVPAVMQAVGTGNRTTGDTGAGQFSVSRTGALVYVPSVEVAPRRRSLVWVSPDGRVTPTAAPLKGYGGPRLSPNGRLVVVHAEERLWVYDRDRGVLAQLAPGPGIFWPAWKPDGKLVTIAPSQDIVSLSLDGREIERLKTSGSIHPPGSWSPDGGTLLFTKLGANGAWEIRAISRAGVERKVRPATAVPVSERYPQFSPDGEWFVYASNESGRDEVWVERYATGERHQISDGGGTAPVWARDGLRLFHAVPGVQGRIRMMAVDVTLRPAFSAGRPRALFEGRFPVGTPHRNYDVLPEGGFVMLQEEELPAPPPVTQVVLVLNWFEELKRQLPSGR